MRRSTLRGPARKQATAWFAMRVVAAVALLVPLAAIPGRAGASDIDPANGVNYSDYQIFPEVIVGGTRGSFLPYVYDDTGNAYLPGDPSAPAPAERHYRIAFERDRGSHGGAFYNADWQIYVADLVRVPGGGWTIAGEHCISCADADQNGGYNGLPDVARVPIYDRETGSVARYEDRIVYLSSRDHDPYTLLGPGGGNGQEIYVMNADGSRPRAITQDFGSGPSTADNYHARFSPTGRYILWSSAWYEAGRPLYWDVRIAEYREYNDGTYAISHPTSIAEANDGAWYETHGFDPAETRIYISTTTDSSMNSEEWAIPLSRIFVNGELPGGRHPVPYSERIRLTNNDSWDEHIAASPTGNKIAFISSRNRPSLANDYIQAAHSAGIPPSAADWGWMVPFTAVSWAQPVMKMNTDYVLANPDGSDQIVLGPQQHDHISARSDWSPDGFLLLGDWRGEKPQGDPSGAALPRQLVIYEFAH